MRWRGTEVKCAIRGAVPRKPNLSVAWRKYRTRAQRAARFGFRGTLPPCPIPICSKSPPQGAQNPEIRIRKPPVLDSRVLCSWRAGPLFHCAKRLYRLPFGTIGATYGVGWRYVSGWLAIPIGCRTLTFGVGRDCRNHPSRKALFCRGMRIAASTRRRLKPYLSGGPSPRPLSIDLHRRPYKSMRNR